MGEGLLQPTHLVLILLLALILFGAGKLSDVGGALGKSVREFRQGLQEPGSGTTPAAASQASASAARHCPQCSQTVRSEDRFCPNCGADLVLHRIA